MSFMAQERKYSLLIIVAAVNWGMIGIFVRNLRQCGFSAIEISSLRYIFSAFTAVVVLLIKKNKHHIELRDIWKFAFLGLVSTMGTSILYFLCMQLTSAAVSNVLMYTAPIWVLIYSVLFSGYKLTKGSIASIFFVFSGCVLVSGIIGEENLRYGFWGIITGIASGIVYSSYTIMGKVLSKKYPSFTVIIYSFIFSGIGSLFFISVKKASNIIIKTPTCIVNIMALSLIGTVIPYGLYTMAIKSINEFKAAVICTAEPVTATIISAVVLKEKISLLQLMGIFIIICTIIIINSNPLICSLVRCRKSYRSKE